jgi:WD40 repeat protein
VTVNSANKLFYYDLLEGSVIDIYSNQKLGISIAKFADNHYTIICASTSKSRPCAYVWRLDTNTILFTTSGHSSPVISLSICPNSHLFSSTSTSQLTLITNYSTSATLLSRSPIITSTFDNLGLIFCTASSSTTSSSGLSLHLYSLNSFSSPFNSHFISLDHFPDPLHSMQFSKNGKYLVLTSITNSYMTVKLAGNIEYCLVMGQGVGGRVSEVGLSP